MTFVCLVELEAFIDVNTQRCLSFAVWSMDRCVGCLQLAASKAKMGEKQQELSTLETERDGLGAKVEALAKQVEVRLRQTNGAHGDVRR